MVAASFSQSTQPVDFTITRVTPTDKIVAACRHDSPTFDCHSWT
jgi:hypothetical protein